MNVLITGATGFVGSAVARQLSMSQDRHIVVAVRRQPVDLPQSIHQILVGDLLAGTDYMAVLEGVDVVVHAAARVHVMQDDAGDPLADYRRVNVEGTLNLARQAVKAGVKRFVFISSVKVNGELTGAGKPFTPHDRVMPDDPYALSKWEAEQGLFKLAEETGLEVVVIRSPLVYGPGVKANFKKMIQWLDKGIPLPFGAVHNKRSLIALENLVSFIILCIEHPKAKNELFLISDGEDISTTQLLRKVGASLDKPARLFPVPVSIMRFMAGLLGKEDMGNRLFGSLQVDSSKPRILLDWKPVITMDGQLQKMFESKK